MNNLLDAVLLSFGLATLAGMVIGSIFTFEAGCLASFVVGFLLIINIGKIK